MPLLATYARLKLGELRGGSPEAGSVRSTSLLGCRVSFFDWYWLIEMYEEIFLRSQYRFVPRRSRPLVLDVGSNIGVSILYFKWLCPDARIIGFEPDPETFGVLAANVRENELLDVELVNAAAHDGADSIELHRDPRTPGSPQASTRARRVSGVTTTVAACRLSDHLTEKVDFMKLDVEGAELDVASELERSGKLVLVDRMTVEYHHHVDGDQDRLSELLSLLERNGFGYQLEARIAASGRPEQFQNVIVRAYRKGTQQIQGESEAVQ